MFKNKEILIYIDSNYTHIYFKNQNRTIIEKNNNIIKNSEIVNVEKTLKHLLEIDKKYNIYNGYLKPNLTVLYNDLVSCDIIYLYKEVLQDFNYKNIDFIKLSDLIKNIKNSDRILLYDNNCYISFSLCKTFNQLNNLPFEPIIIGSKDSKFKYYSDKFFIWNSFLRYFTKN